MTQAHPEIGKSGAVEIVRYQFFVEREQPSGPDGFDGTDAESFMTPADTLSCRRQTYPENTPNLALSHSVPTLDPLTDMAISGGGPA